MAISLLDNDSADIGGEERAPVVDSSSWVDRSIVGGGLVIALIHFVFYGFETLTRRTGVDENLTGWIISDSFIDSIVRSATHQGQSPLYFMGLWLWSSLFGSSIVVLRLPTLVAHFATAWQIHRLGESIASRRAGLIASAFFLGLNPNAYDARPYTFLVLGVVVAARLAIRWSEQPSSGRGVAWAVAAAFVLYMHPFGIYAVLPQAIFLWSGRRNGASLRDIATVAAASALFVMPMVPQVLQLSARQSTLVIVDLPTVSTFYGQVLPGPVAIVILAGLLVNLALPRIPEGSQRMLMFVVAWALLPAIALYVQSHVSGDSTFVRRYMNGAYPGLALTMGLLFSWLRDKRLVVVPLLLFAVLLPSTLRPLVAPEWDPATAIIADSPDALIVTMSGYIELADSDAFPPSTQFNEYFNAPLRWHGAEGPLHAIPRDASPKDIASIRSTLQPAIATGQTVVLVDFVWREREEGPLFAESLLLENGYSIDLVDEAIGPHTTRFVSAQ